MKTPHHSMKKRHKLRRRSKQPFIPGALEKLSDLALIGVIFVAPLFMGGRHPAGRFAYISLVSVFAIAWSLRQAFVGTDRLRRSGAEWLLVLGLLLIGLQIVPLSGATMKYIAPFQQELLPLWNGTDVSIGIWNTISLCPTATRLGMATYLAHVLLFLTLVQRLRSLDDIQTVVRYIAFAAFGMACIGLLQYFAGTDKFAWVFTHPSRKASRLVSGPFSNPNHFGHFVALGVAPLIWYLNHMVTSVSKGRRRFATAANRSRSLRDFASLITVPVFGIIILASFLSGSRGGMLVVFLAGLVGLVLMYFGGLTGKGSLAALLFVSAVVGVALFIHGFDRVQSELETLTSVQSLDKGQSRQRIWAANLETAKHFPICGSGLGTHAEMYRRFYPYASNKEFTHAESTYLQIVSELGIAGISLVLMGVLVCARWCIRALRSAHDKDHYAVAAAVTASLFVSCLHSAVDFAWHLSASMGITVILASCAVSLAKRAPADAALVVPGRDHAGAFPRSAWWCITATIAFLALTATRTTLPAAKAAHAWTQYLDISLNSRDPLTEHRRDVDPEEVAALDLRRTHEMATQLQATIDADPNNWRAHVRMAGVCLRLFDHLQLRSENAMGLAQIRDAAISSQFSDRDAQDRWLETAIGPQRRWLDKARYHCHRGLIGSPLQSNGYVYLSQLSWLDGSQGTPTRQLISQAHRVRPHDAGVLFAMGRQAAMDGDTGTALDYWRDSFHMDDQYRDAIIGNLALQVPVTFMLQQFEPDEAGIRALLRFYRFKGMDEQARVVAGLLVQQVVAKAAKTSGREARQYWSETVALYRFLGDEENTLAAARQMIRAIPQLVSSHEALVTELLRQEKWDEAITELRWCLKRRPHDPQLERRYKYASRLRRLTNHAQPTEQSRIAVPAGEQRF